MSANQISQDANLSIALVAFHLKKMQDVGIIKITKTGKSVKGQDVKYYSATNQSFLITPARHTESILDSVQ
jgi:predicted transcriptional regulator